MPASWWAAAGRKPEETPSIEQDRGFEMNSAERPDDGAETIPADSRYEIGNVEVGSAGMKRPFRGVQGQIAAEESLLEAGGSPLS